MTSKQKPIFFSYSTPQAPYRLLYRPQLVADGNMKLTHLIMKRPEDDVSLSDGDLFMVRRARYAAGSFSDGTRTTAGNLWQC